MRCCSSCGCSVFAGISGVVFGHGVMDDTVKEMVGNGVCHGGWGRWFKEGDIVVGLSWTGVGGREFAVGGHVVGACWFIHDGDNWDGSTEADGMGGVHFVDRGGVVAGAGGEGAWGGGCHGGPVGWFWRRCVDNTVGCGD